MLFDESFCTDYDESILDYISKNYKDFNESGGWYASGKQIAYILHKDFSLSHDYNYEYLTKQQFKEKIGMTTKQFSKKDLVAGKHVVELADGSRYLLVNVLDKVVGFNLQCDSKGIHDNWYTHLEEGLVYPYNEDLTVVAVYEVIDINVYLQCSDRNIKSIWEREEKSPAQIELEKLQNQIAELQAQANKLQSTL